MPGQIRSDINRIANTVISVAEEYRQTGRWAQALIRAAKDGAVKVEMENKSGEPPLQASAKFLAGEVKEFPFCFLFSVTNEGEK